MSCMSRAVANAQQRCAGSADRRKAAEGCMSNQAAWCTTGLPQGKPSGT